MDSGQNFPKNADNFRMSDIFPFLFPVLFGLLYLVTNENRSPILIDDLGWSDIGENLDLASEMPEKIRKLAIHFKT